MKHFLISCLFLLTLSALSAQIVDSDYPFYSFTQPEKVMPIGDGRWLVVGKIKRYSDDSGADSVFAVIIDRNHQTLLKKVLPLPPTETYYGLEAYVVDNNSFIIAVYRGGCDYSTLEAILQKYNVSGTLEWSLQGVVQGEKLPFTWQIGPDGHLLGCGPNRVWKIDVNTGNIIWRADREGSAWDDYVFDFALLPGTEDLLTDEYPGLKIWKKYDGPNAPFYALENTVPVEGFMTALKFAPNGWCYVVNHDNSGTSLERYSPSLTRQVLVGSTGWQQIRDVAIADDGLYILGRDVGQNWLRKTDFLGQNPVELPMPTDWWLRGHVLAVKNDTVIIAGADGSGPKSVVNDHSTYSLFEFQTQHLWVRTFSGLSPISSNDSSNAAVTGIQKLSLVNIGYHSSNGLPYFTLQGGNFQIEITNKGNIPLEEVSVNFGYEEDQVGICFYSASMQRKYTHLGLAPGASTWVSFGDLILHRQSSLAENYCFWTSAPNNAPDTHHEDDHYCVLTYLPVGTYTPSGISLSLFPNPAQDYCKISNIPDAAGAEWQLHDPTGRLMQQGIYPVGQLELTISTAQLPDGFYIFKMNNYVGKLIVKH